MTFGYDSVIAFSKSVANIDDKALDLLNRLGTVRAYEQTQDSQPRSIMFICHSLGGIIVKKALILAHERSSDPSFKDILEHTKALVFLGVPHRGADAAWWADTAASFLKAASLNTATSSTIISDLKKNSPTLMSISKQFVDRSKDLKIYTFYERETIGGVLVSYYANIFV